MPTWLQWLSLSLFQFTHPGRGATGRAHYVSAVRWVSIHAPREGCDSGDAFRRRYDDRFNSRTPGGVRRYTTTFIAARIMFQFTHPGRGATLNFIPHKGQDISFNSRTPGGVRPITV